MADLKISALTGATTPLAGTEVLPIVQSSTTVKVSVANLTAGRAVSTGALSVVAADATLDNAYSLKGKLVAGTAVGMILRNSSNQVAIDADGYGTVIGFSGTRLEVTSGNATLQNGNLIQGTAAKGVNFSANTPAAGMTSQLLNWYEEGTFTPTYGGSTTNPTVTYTDQIGYYTRIGRVVTIGIRLVVTSATGGSGNLIVNGLPFTGLASTGGLSLQFVLGFASNVLQPALSGTSLILYDTYAGTSNTQSPVSALTSAGGTTFLVLGGTYMV